MRFEPELEVTSSIIAPILVTKSLAFIRLEKKVRDPGDREGIKDTWKFINNPARATDFMLFKTRKREIIENQNWRERFSAQE